MKVLLIEDEQKVAKSLAKGLSEHQIDVDFALDGLSGKALAEENTYDVIVSDVIMPGMDGITLLKLLRASNNRTPVIMLTALGEIESKVEGLDAGADDYLVKPFEFRELLSRIRALSRRSQESGATGHHLTFSTLTVNTAHRSCARDGVDIDLTPKEFQLIEYFLRNPGRVISKTELAEKVWDISFENSSNVVEVYINYLRNKIDKPFSRKLLHTVFGTGYILRET